MLTTALIIPFVIVCLAIVFLGYVTAQLQRGPFAFAVQRLLHKESRVTCVRIGRSLYAVAATIMILGTGVALWPTAVLPLVVWVAMLLPLLAVVVQAIAVREPV